MNSFLRLNINVVGCNKNASVLEKLPKNLQRQAKGMLQETWMSDTKNIALRKI